MFGKVTERIRGAGTACDQASVVVERTMGERDLMEWNGLREKGLELLSRLAEAHGAPGREHSVRRIFREELGSVETDRMGNVFSIAKGSQDQPRIMVSGHMDEVGFVVQSIQKSGLIRFLPLGGWWSNTLLAQRVRILTRDGKEIPGVIGAKPPHFLSDTERDKVMKVEDMFIDVGAANGEEVRRDFGIRPGDSIVPYSPFSTLRNPDYLLCKAFDNRVGMALTIQVLQMLRGLDHPNTVYGVGTVQEEFGMKGGQTAVQTVNPDAAIVLEGTPADDFPGVPEEEQQGALGKGVQIRIQDPSAIMNSEFVEYALKMAQSQGIPHQVAVRRSGGTDAKPIQLHRHGVPTIVLGVPARYIHTHNSIIHTGDYLSALQLIVAIVQQMDTRVWGRLTSFS